MDGDKDEVRVHLRIRGRVQGVYFRASIVYEAQNFGLTGWVRNCPDGSVEAIAEGGRDKVEELIAWCRRGPSGARVENVAVDWQAVAHEFLDFQIKR
jgi:acylphosphatase